MRNSRFLKQLRKELPAWQARGWVTDSNAKAILDHVAQQASVTHLLAYALAILGVLLLGSGIITWFAANWQAMAKIAKLAVLLGALYISYGVAGYLLSKDRTPKVGQAVLLLGVILFGANIMLIAQIYHIDTHYPNGVLLWALGGLLTAYLLQSQPAMVATLALGTLWTGMENFGFNHVHGGFLLLWAACLPAIYLRRWFTALHVALISVIVWTVFCFFSAEAVHRSGQQTFLVQLYFLVYLGAFIGSMLMRMLTRLQDFAHHIQNYSIVAALFSLYVLTFPGMQSGLRWYHDMSFRPEADTFWNTITLAAVMLIIALAALHHFLTSETRRSRYVYYGYYLVGASVALIAANLYLTGVHGSWIALAFNLLYFGSVIWLMFAGVYTGNRFLINSAFIFFALGLLSRYFDTFWTLLNRSFFFMTGGLILIIGGYLLEQQRRKLTAKVTTP